jgi:hypothetical protein
MIDVKCLVATVMKAWRIQELLSKCNSRTASFTGSRKLDRKLKALQVHYTDYILQSQRSCITA